MEAGTALGEVRLCDSVCVLGGVGKDEAGPPSLFHGCIFYVFALA